MIFSRRLSFADLIDLCRVMRHYLSAGMSLPDVFRQQAKNGSNRIRAASGRITQRLERGGALEDALARESAVFPPLMLSLASVGEHTGMLPEICADLENYYLQQQQLRRSFRAAVAWPVVQSFLAIFVVAALIYFLGFIKSLNPSSTYDPLGLSLAGSSGVAIFLGIVFGTLIAAVLLVRLVAKALQGSARCAALLLYLPVLGPSMRALAVSRFCLSLRLTTESAMPLADALRLSLRATDNAAFIARTGQVQSTVRKGRELTLALTGSRLFPEEFLRILAVAEESGQLSDVLKQQAAHYQEESSRRMKAVAAVASGAVWLCVGGGIIAVIFKLYLGYFSMLRGI